MRRTLWNVTTGLLRPFAKIWFLTIRAIQHDLFVRQRGIPESRIWLYPFGILLRAFRAFSACWESASASAALATYAQTSSKHYSRDGLAYGHLSEKSEEALREHYLKLKGRIRHYMRDDRVLSYRDGDSFLDCGCGSGQNIIELRRAFPHSPVRGFDFNASAVATVKAGTKGDELVHVEQGSILDHAFLRSIPSSSVDHVIMSHVMGFLMKQTIDETKRLRQGIVDELVRISRKTVIILDRIEPRLHGFSVRIEQRNRGVVHEDLTQYFNKHVGNDRYYVLLSPEDEAIAFVKPSAALTGTGAPL